MTFSRIFIVELLFLNSYAVGDKILKTFKNFLLTIILIVTSAISVGTSIRSDQPWTGWWIISDIFTLSVHNVWCSSCGPGPPALRAAAGQGRGQVTNIWDPGPTHTRARDLNQVMKNRSGHRIIQSSSLIRFLGPVICVPGLKPCPCVCDVRTGGHFLLIVHQTRFHARYTRVWERAIKPKHTHHSLLLSRSEITSQQFQFLSIFHHSRSIFLVVVTTAITLPEF